MLARSAIEAVGLKPYSVNDKPCHETRDAAEGHDCASKDDDGKNASGRGPVFEDAHVNHSG